jgi:hypothetical protein
MIHLAWMIHLPWTNCTGVQFVETNDYNPWSWLISEVTDPRAWWLEPTQRKTYPNFSIMALDILSIPAMSAEPERLFSGAKSTITDRRNRLGIKSIEAIES